MLPSTLEKCLERVPIARGVILRLSISVKIGGVNPLVMARAHVSCSHLLLSCAHLVSCLSCMLCAGHVATSTLESCLRLRRSGTCVRCVNLAASSRCDSHKILRGSGFANDQVNKIFRRFALNFLVALQKFSISREGERSDASYGILKKLVWYFCYLQASFDNIGKGPFTHRSISSSMSSVV